MDRISIYDEYYTTTSGITSTDDIAICGDIYIKGYNRLHYQFKFPGTDPKDIHIKKGEANIYILKGDQLQEIIQLINPELYNYTVNAVYQHGLLTIDLKREFALEDEPIETKA